MEWRGDAPVKLKQTYDLHAIAVAMQQKPDYTVAEFKSLVRVERSFGPVPYYIDLQLYPNDPATYLSIQASESCSILDIAVRHHVATIVDDMPLTSAQKSELKRYVSTRTTKKSVWSF